LIADLIDRDCAVAIDRLDQADRAECMASAWVFGALRARAAK
jgi:hypothetical protein